MLDDRFPTKSEIDQATGLSDSSGCASPAHQDIPDEQIFERCMVGSRARAGSHWLVLDAIYYRSLVVPASAHFPEKG